MTIERFPSLLLCALLFNAALFAQDDRAQRDAAAAAMQARTPADTTGKLWTTGGSFQVNLTQVSLTNWAAGGFNSLGGIAQFNGFANRHKGRYVWDNSLALAFGGQLQSAQGESYSDGTPIKTDDRIELNSKWGYELKKPWYFATLAQFKTQFTEGFDATGNRISNLFAPAYLIVGVGFDYRPSDDFSVFMSPATMKMTMVNDKTLFGGSTDPDLRVYGVKNGSTTELELGGYIRAQYKKELAKNITFLTRGDLFSNYLRNPQNIDVTWENLFTFKVNDWFAATLSTMLIYDHDIDVPKLKEVDGVKVPAPGPGTQFKQTLGVGLTLKL
ncbi:MAG: DUF3078 domain-containing protein [Flavobacteriales bacterium]|nr:DUF3078 domain-containing protein [Flavobacteriales bacterium]MBK6755603.1 DUF3078 domain-containing protein [Flavobacteriales bacterium]MBK9076875.1 DUF3078 domain-containing protein [Flavobacteriales bacterium]MBK9538273.1 DUF3078 domain-containing protein [Flavobacteriales bacterium]